GDGRRGDHELTRSQLVERAHDLINPWRPANRHGDDGWRAEPVEDVRGQLPAGAHELAGQLAARGATVMALLYEDRPVAVVGIGEKLDPFARALIAAARCADRVVIAGSGRRVQRLRGLLEPDDICPGGGALVDSVRELQRDGHVVALVDASHGAALAAADLGIGLVTPGHRPPWGAQVLVTGTRGACQVLDAITPARRASRRGVQLALVGSGLAALLAVLGPGFGAARRAHFGVHTTALVAFGAGVWEASELTRLPGAVAVDDTPWHAMSARAVLEAVGSSRAGISEQEARRRDTRTARRELDEPNLVRASLAELATPLTPALGIGAGLAAATGSVLDSALILTVLGLNALIGGVQRVGAQRSLRALRHTSDSRVRVRRPHAGAVVRPNQLVVGDVVALQAGQAVPADCRLLEAQGLEVDESSLTGESLPVAKSARACAALSVSDRFSMLYEGTTIAAGRAEAVVTAIEDSTEAGRALRLRESAPPTGVELRLRKLTTRVLPFSAAAGLILIAVDLLRVRPLATSLSRAVGLAVAAVPEGLPFVATVAELAAARRLSGRGALVRNPSTIEALGRVTTLCFDKTGTLTEGRIALRTVGDGVDVAPVSDTLPPPLQEVLAVALRASPFHLDPRHVTHQTDRAVLAGAADLGLPAAYGHERLEHIAELAFESSRGYHATLWRGATALHLSVKGAPEVVLPLCARWSRAAHAVPLDDQARAQIGDQVHRLAQQGQRVLAVAEARLPATAQIPHPDSPAKLTEADLVDLDFVGLVGLFDPIRPTAARSVATLRAAGVDVIMITGDHPSTARTIAAELDAVNGRHVLTGAGLDELDDEKLAATLPDIAVFARVTPAQKARIVRALQQIGAVVAVTGDGTNDAPAIRLADVGIALGSRATPAAREAADLVVTDDRIETITDAIVEGRALWSSVRDALSILLGGNLGEIAYTLGTGLLDGGESLNARQLLLINLLTDVLPAMAVAVRPPPDLAPDQLLAEGPEDSLGASLNRDIALRAATTSVAASAAWFLARPLSTPGQASTTGLVALVAAQLGQTIAVRGRTPLVIAAALGSLGLLALAVQTPGVSHIVGSRPLLPHQWGLALTAASAATAAQLLGQRLTDLS
ncbi:MAG: cation-translocating P-type ATPase, partial [Pseudonocardia sp.]|nr:cation-translocating P-type ATPase [Pseudonocardia sp.]